MIVRFFYICKTNQFNMKKLFLLAAFFLLSKTLPAQIVFEHAYDSVVFDYNGNNFGFFAPFRISENEVKYVHVDSLTITIYNLDHTIFNVINIPLMQPLNDNDEVEFISRSLFDSDSTNIEYMVYGKDLSGVTGCHIYRDDGTQIFTAPGFWYQPQLLILGATRTFTNLINTTQGTKLLLVNYLGKVKVWGLPGTYYPFTGNEDLTEENMDIGMPLPNPSATSVEIPMTVPPDAVNPRLVMVSEKGEEILNQPLIPGQRSIYIDVKKYAGSMYFVTLLSENGRSRTRKVLIR